LRRDARLVLVAMPEEMSVAETLETVDAVREAGLPEPVIVVNRVLPSPFPKGTRAAGLRLDERDLVRILTDHGVRADEGEAGGLLQAVRDLDTRTREERRFIERLAKAAPVIELPFLFTPTFGPDEVDVLAGTLEAAA